MSSGHAPITPVGTLVTIFVTLLICTGLTVAAATHDFGSLNTPVALLIAVFKASLVITFFMAVRYNTPLTKTVVVSGFLWLLILFALGLNDYLTRAWIGVPGR
jgi:cytochrome c oxidase subunit 4